MKKAADRELMILSEKIVGQVAALQSQGPELYLSYEALFPDGYMEYLMRVLSPMKESEIWEVAKGQIRRLKTTGAKGVKKILEVKRDGKIQGIVIIV